MALGVTLLEVGAPAAPDEQTIAGERHASIIEHVSQAAACMARCLPDLKVTITKSDDIVLH